MNLLILLQHIQDKPTITQIADGGSNAALIQAVIMSLATGVAGFMINNFLKRPSEKIEQYEAAELKAIRDGFTEFKETHRRDKAEWHIWRDGTTKDITTLQLQQQAQATLFAELKADVSKTKENTNTIRETMVELKAQVQETLTKWVR